MDDINELSNFPNMQKNSYLEILLLSQGNWPLNITENQNMELFAKKAQEITALTQLKFLSNFHDYYKYSFAGKLLSINLFYGHMEVNMNWNKKNYTVYCNSIQGVICLLLNSLALVNAQNKNNSHGNSSNLNHSNSNVSSNLFNLNGNYNSPIGSFLSGLINASTGEISLRIIKFLVCNVRMKEEVKSNSEGNNSASNHSSSRSNRISKISGSLSAINNRGSSNANNQGSLNPNDTSQIHNTSTSKDRESSQNFINKQIDAIANNTILPHLIPMIKLGMISHNQETDMIKFDTKFHSNSLKIVLGVAKLKEEVAKENAKAKEDSSDQQEIASQRKFITESAIIRIMKQKIKANFNDIVASAIEAVKDHFFPDILYLKTIIENLCERMLLKRDESNLNVFCY
eukprot:CAMPEP_0170537942 /NCGR_PEP_ID=MMETSP0209-20121228/103018_1 /TAXON_ID=665100 ORGANISM="Litonotus pictus, Strain P1" /NCGR_SAMPLE_ID=MMETSP0209 /ASSEMBLY_ACC=CAM_ASM_000301 /LENGTH=400 /DNA_ID=CAMNT_0010839541 /DNA_START=1372 /DNA_END=2571 /DNA_ORIENTATION=-